MRSYLCKYIPPRANFLDTMTDAEKDLMRRHGDFLDHRLEQGLIVAHGPVMDPTGSYGMSLYRLPEGQRIEELTAQDPIVKAGCGHYEHYPMLHLKS